MPGSISASPATGSARSVTRCGPCIRRCAPFPGTARPRANLAAFMLLRGNRRGIGYACEAVIERDPGCNPGAASTGRMHCCWIARPDRGAGIAQGSPPAGRDGAHWRALPGRPGPAAARRRRGRARGTGCRDGSVRCGNSARSGDVSCSAMHARDVPSAEVLAEQMAKLADDTTGVFLEHRIIGHFELARFHDARGRRSTAFKHWKRGHRLLADVQPFSREHHAAFVANSIACLNDTRLRTGRPRAQQRSHAGVHSRHATFRHHAGRADPGGASASAWRRRARNDPPADQPTSARSADPGRIRMLTR